jgi:NDP-sugar pyrophosphorylase family protein
MLEPSAFFDLTDFPYRALFDGLAVVWDALARLEPFLEGFLREHGAHLRGTVAPGAFVGPDVSLAEGAVVEPGAYVAGPTVIGPGAVVRHGAYVRGFAVVGARCIVGHASEVKSSVLFDDSAAPHFAYVGDSILGRRVNIGAGTKLSNFGLFSFPELFTGHLPSIQLTIDGTVYDTGMPKLGAILGDDAQTGCNAVTAPGCLVGPRTVVYSGVSLPKGYYGPDLVLKLRQDLLEVERR